ncbi:MAG: nicotinate (nicotinamide) nucleotide adenylyltransferase [Saprospiraceae bacterium]
MKVGLFFGSFNPVHTGHMVIANFMATQTDLDMVWIVVSPHNPFKDKKTLARDYDRLHLVNLAIGNNMHLKATDIEFSLPKPSYTIDTLTYLAEKHPDKTFCPIIGSDNLDSFTRWKNYEMLIERYQFYVYSRPGYEAGIYRGHPKFSFFEAPMMDISATYIRQCIQSGKSVEYLVPDAVFADLEQSGLYRH